MAGHSRHITFHTARQDLRADFEEFRRSAPAKLLVTEHRTLQGLVEVLSQSNPNVEMIEIVGHGTPLSCGEILPINGGELRGALARYPPSVSVVLSGCNTGVATDPCSISQYLADQVNRPILGVRGYVSGYAVMETLRCTKVDPQGTAYSVYEGSADARFPRSLQKFFPQRVPLQPSQAKPRFGATELKRELAKLSTVPDPIEIADQIVHAITRGGGPATRRLRVGAEAIFVHEGIEFELCSNFTAVGHYGDCWHLVLSSEADRILRKVVLSCICS